MTVALYARQKSWPLEAVTVRLRHSKIHAADCADCEIKKGMLDRIESDLVFVITGRTDATGCNISQFDFLPAGNSLTGQGGHANIIFRIPTPLFGAGLIEGIPHSAILANMQSSASQKSALGISGHANGSDATAGVKGALSPITISELQAQLKRDHAGCAITAQTNAK
jgi:hypothetical protein